ncbi:MAG: hypothetical protein K5879_08150 [Lachnospiraceae bacterium]|nr:hypothetical protein [Lachnospiraceae bacterium]
MVSVNKELIRVFGVKSEENQNIKAIGETIMGQTKLINIFNQERRSIKCIARTHDYLGIGEPITEAELEVGKLYTYIGGVKECYGNMVFLEELPKEYGYQAYLFEELEAYDEDILHNEEMEWLIKALKEARASGERDGYIPVEEVVKKLKMRHISRREATKEQNRSTGGSNYERYKGNKKK